MRLTNLIPTSLKPIFRRIHYSLRKMTYRPKSRDEIHKYWKQPYDGDNLPEDYLREDATARSQFLVGIIQEIADPDVRILEVGCGVGRNLNFLFNAGFRNLEGIEISEQAVQVLRHTFPEMARFVKIYNVSVEEAMRELGSEYDIVFTMAVLEHIHTDSEWVFPEIVRVAKNYLITIEDEGGISWRHFPRNYKEIFEPLDMKQIDEISNMEKYGLANNFVTRIFQKQS